MVFFLLGVNHKTAPVHLRERLAFSKDEILPALTSLVDRATIDEALIVSTCNRVEILATVETVEHGYSRIVEFLGEHRDVDPASLREHLYTHFDRAAVSHIFRVASSLDSLVVGEPQILGQVREAYQSGLDAGTVGRRLSPLMQSALATAKRVRTETAIGENAVSVSFVAVELGRKIFGSLRGKSALLVGAGEMAELAATHLLDNGATNLVVVNRTIERATELAERFNGSARPFDKLGEALEQVDIVICSTGATEFVLGPSHFKRALEARRNRPFFLIDISVPRQIDPASSELENVYLFDMDDLQRVVESNLREREREARVAETIVDDEVAKFLTRLRTNDIGPTVAELKDRLNEVAVGEFTRLRKRLGGLSPDQEELIVSLLLPSIINKISHPIISHMRDSAAEETEHVETVSIWKRIFRLGGSDRD